MILDNCEILFLSHPQHVFHVGEVVTGKISLTLRKPYKIRELIFKVKGNAKCQWTESHGTGDDRKETEFKGFQEILYISSNLLAAEVNQGSSMELQAGVHNFDFSFSIPQGLPSSYESIFGRVRYSASVTSKCPNKFDNTRKVPFTVISTVDLNFNPQYSVPLKHNASKKFVFLFTTKGNLNVEVDIPASGFVPGQYIPMKCHMENTGKVKVLEVKFSLRMVTTYWCTIPHRQSRLETLKASQIVAGGVKRGESIVFDVALTVPSVPPSSIGIDCIITHEYLIKVNAKVSGMHSNLVSFIPITVGTIPLNNNNMNGSITSPIGFVVPPTFGDFGPPTYEEAMSSRRMENIDKNDDGDLEVYKPKYPVYKFS